jgi:hypothetical protein
MPTGTEAPPTSDLIERFNALMDDLVACVTLEALRAAGVPWVVRVLLARFIRRRIARWSSDFSGLVADARAGRTALAGRAAGPAVEADAEAREQSRRGGAMPRMERARSDPSASSGRRPACETPAPSISADIVVLSEKLCGRSERRRGRPRRRTYKPDRHAGSRRRWVNAIRRPPAVVAWRHEPSQSRCVFRSGAGVASSHGHFVTIS